MPSHREPPQELTRRDFLVTTLAIAATDAAAGLAAFGCTPRVRGPAVAPAGDSLEDVVDALRRLLPRRMVQRDIPGLSVALVIDRRVAWTEGFGHTDRTRREPVSPDTLFFAGSVSKCLTALGVLTAVRDRRLALDEPVVRHLPWFTPRHGPSRAVTGAMDGGAGEPGAITLRHLLSHHAGLGTWPPLGNPYDPAYHDRAFDEVARSVADSWRKFPAGARFEYSNQGFVLAGAVLQAATGTPFPRYVSDAVLEPLGMTASTFDQRAVTARAGFAVPYTGARPVPLRNGIVHPMTPAGGLATTARDLARLVAFFLQDGRAIDSSAGPLPSMGAPLVDASLLAEMTTPQGTARGTDAGYGLGLYRAIQHGTPRLSHGGVGFGISAHVRWLPEHGLGIAVLTNQDAVHHAPALADEAVALVLRARLGALPEPVPASARAVATPVPESALHRLAGTYLLYDGIMTAFEVRRGALYQRAGREAVRLVALSPTEFAHGSRRFRFALDGAGIAGGVHVLDPHFDPSTTENSVLYLARNDGPRRPGTRSAAAHEAWAARAGRYRGTFVGAPAVVRFTARDGALYLDDTLRLTPAPASVEHGTFVLADGEPVAFAGDRVVVGNRPFAREGS